MTTHGSEATACPERLWEALRRARAGEPPQTQAHLEDALFHHYRPMARSMAADYASAHPDQDGVEQAAEAGLAEAILAWRHRDPDRFVRFARSAISTRLRGRGTTPRWVTAIPTQPAEPTGL